MTTVQRVLALGSFGFAFLTFFSTLGLMAAFKLVGVEAPTEFADANKVSLGALLASFQAAVSSFQSS